MSSRRRTAAIIFSNCTLVYLILILFTSIASATTIINYDIHQSTTWTLAGSPYVIPSSILIDEEATLTIEAGTQVLLDCYVSMLVVGGIIVNGTVDNPVNFLPYTSSCRWGRIWIGSSRNPAVFDSSNNYISGSILQNMYMTFAGKTAVSGAATADALHVRYTSIYMNNVKIYDVSRSAYLFQGRLLHLST
jgi:hypothetical protein